MEAPQRSRPRPYDLRRKVLLKNFLREQMTHIPMPPPRMQMEDEAIADDEVSSTVGNEENIEQDSNIQEMTNKLETASPVPASPLEPVPSTSTENSPDSSTSQEQEMEVDKSTQPTFTRLSNLLRLKINSVRSRRKGITKAKLKMKVKSPAHPSVLRAVNNTQQSAKGNKSKSFFALFKTRRGKRPIKSPPTRRISSPVVSKSTTSEISVQTDISFTQDEFSTMEQSNRSLREENRLLSESLSSFMSDFDLKLSPLKIPYGTDSYITSSGSSESPSVSSHQTSPDVAKRLDYNDSASRNKIARSKSMQDRFDKKFPNRSRLRTRSMNYSLNKRFYDSSSLQQRGPHPYRRDFPPDNTPRINTARRGKPRPNSFSAFDSRPNRISAPDSNSRMSPHQPSVFNKRDFPTDNIMPGLRRRKPRPNSFSAFDSCPNRIPPPASSSRMSPHKASVLKNLPINNSSRAIVRRSSMPERTSYQPSRPILRHKSTRANGYNRGNGYDNGHNYNAVNCNVPIRRRSNSNGDYGRNVPFQNLPPEAFY